MAQNERRRVEPMSFSGFKNNLNLKPATDPVPVIGGTGTLPVSVFGKERERKDMEGYKMAMKTEFVKMYSYEELGKKLRELRPDGNIEGKAWFSLGELNERLMKLREKEDRQTESSNVGVFFFKDLRESLVRMKMSDDEKAKKSSSK